MDKTIDIRETPMAHRQSEREPTSRTMAIALIMGAVTALGVLLAARIRDRQTREWTTGTRTGSTAGAARGLGPTQRQIAEKALRMKQEAGPQTNIPEYQTSHEGGVRGGQMGYTDTALGREGTYTENTGRSHGSRSGDMGG